MSTDGQATAHYEYDANGNRTSVTTPSGTVSAFYDDQDRLLNQGTLIFTYTANGEVRTKTDTSTGQVTTYTYDALGNLREVDLPDGRVVTYRIDSNQRRIQKLINGVPVQGFLYRDRLRIVAELDGANNVVSRFVHPDGEGADEMVVANALTRLGIYTVRTTPGGPGRNVPAYMVRGSDVYGIVSDRLGTPRRVVKVADGTVVQAMDWDAWGVNLGDTAPGFQPFGFAAGLWDRDTGLVRFGARDYDGGVGRWTTRDPLGVAHGPNLYAYSLMNPVNFRDASGEMTDCDACQWSVGVAASIFCGAPASKISLATPAGATAAAAAAVCAKAITDFLCESECEKPYPLWTPTTPPSDPDDGGMCKDAPDASAPYPDASK